MYLWGRAAEAYWGSSRRLYVGHLYMAFVSVKEEEERRRKKEKKEKVDLT